MERVNFDGRMILLHGFCQMDRSKEIALLIPPAVQL